jgi:hypothetical protein
MENIMTDEVIDEVSEQELNTLEDYYFFQSPLYKIEKKEFIDIIKEVSEESLKVVDDEVQHNSLYPMHMSGDFSNDERVAEFSQYVLGTAWNILKHQGYAMDHYNTAYNAMWLQEHHKTSNMEQHIHNDGSQIIAFYFTEVPEDGCKLIIHDPRPGKCQIDLVPDNMQDITMASRMVVITPEVGDLYFTNAWLPHSFSRNGSDSPTKFVHMNIVAFPALNQSCKVPEGPEII